jgi:mRNA interferase MazF
MNGIKKNEIWMADLNPRKGKEQSGLRPVVVISGNAMNQNFDSIIACPLTTKIKNFHGNIILTPSKSNGLKSASEVLVFHIRSIAKERLVKKIGAISDEEVSLIVISLNKLLTY